VSAVGLSAYRLPYRSALTQVTRSRLAVARRQEAGLDEREERPAPKSEVDDEKRHERCASHLVRAVCSLRIDEAEMRTELDGAR